MPTIYVLSRNMKNIRGFFFIWKYSVFGGEIFLYLNRHVFIMGTAVLNSLDSFSILDRYCIGF